MRISSRCWWKVGLVVVLVVAGALLAVSAQQEIKNPNTLIIARSHDVMSLDPAWEFDSASYEIILNIYESLARQKGESLTEYEPVLATVVPSYENALITVGSDGAVYIDFPIREGVYFHYVGVRQDDGSISWKDCDSLTEKERAKIVPGYGELTPEDVKYSIMRALIQDRAGSGVYVLTPGLTGGYNHIEELAKDIAGVDDFAEVDEPSLIETFKAINQAVTVKGHIVEIRLPEPYAPFMGAFIGTWTAKIVDKEWVIAQGGWPGTAETWKNYHDPAMEESVLYEKENGTGPFKLAGWDRTEKVVGLERFEGHWRGPASVEKVVVKLVPEWTTRKLMLQAGDADIADVDQPFLEQVEGMEGVVVKNGLPTLYNEMIAIQWNVAGDSPGIGSGQLDGNGIPPDFFNNLDVRKGFSYAMDYRTYIDQVMASLPPRSIGPILSGILGYSNDQPRYVHDPEKAAEHFRNAYGGKLWEVGFKFTAYSAMPYDGTLRHSLEVLRESLLTINPKFQMEVEILQWSTFLGKVFGEQSMPLWTIASGNDYADPDNSVSLYMASNYFMVPYQGAGFIELAKEEFDPLIAEAAAIFDTAKRELIYDQLQRLAYDYAINLFITQQVGNQVSRDWVQGLIWNPDMRNKQNYWNVWKGY